MSNGLSITYLLVKSGDPVVSSVNIQTAHALLSTQFYQRFIASSVVPKRSKSEIISKVIILTIKYSKHGQGRPIMTFAMSFYNTC